MVSIIVSESTQSLIQTSFLSTSFSSSYSRSLRTTIRGPMLRCHLRSPGTKFRTKIFKFRCFIADCPAMSFVFVCWQEMVQPIYRVKMIGLETVQPKPGQNNLAWLFQILFFISSYCQMFFLSKTGWDSQILGSIKNLWHLQCTMWLIATGYIIRAFKSF